jgi:hypothetical protein
MASLFDGIEKERVRKGPRCGVAILRDELSPEDAKQLDQVLANKAVTTMAIIRRLRTAGLKPQEYPMNRHRRGDCMCGRA